MNVFLFHYYENRSELNEAFQIIHLTTQDNATLMQAAFNLTI